MVADFLELTTQQMPTQWTLQFTHIQSILITTRCGRIDVCLPWCEQRGRWWIVQIVKNEKWLEMKNEFWVLCVAQSRESVLTNKRLHISWERRVVDSRERLVVGWRTCLAHSIVDRRFMQQKPIPSLIGRCGWLINKRGWWLNYGHV